MGYVEIPGIDRTLDTFTFADHGLNCFIVPKYLATAAFGAGNREIFYTYFYLYSHYDLNGLTHDWSEIEEYVLHRKLGLKLETIKIGSDLPHQIMQALDHGCPVFVPVDRGALFYNRKYLENHHPHMFLVKGYNAATGMVMIHDCEQNDKLLNSGLSEPLLRQIGSIYSEFYIPFDMLVACNRSYNEHFSLLKHEIQIMSPSGAVATPGGREALADIARELKPGLTNVAGLLNQKLAFWKRAATGDPTVLRRLTAYLNSQLVLIRTLPKLLPSSGEDSPEVAEAVSAGLSAWETWKQSSTSLALAETRKRNPQHTAEALEVAIVERESRFLHQVCEIGSSLDNCQGQISCVRSGQ